MTPPEFEHFAILVREMRALQKRWFGGDKSIATLHDAKQSERKVDKALVEFSEAKDAKERFLWD